MKINLSLLFAIFHFTLFSQTLIIDDSVSLKKGIYKNFNEFKFNSPSLPLEYGITAIKGTNGSKTIYDTYLLSITKKEAKKIDNIFGFCDGENIYFREQFNDKKFRPILKDKTRYDKIKFLGLHSIYYGSSMTNDINGGMSRGISLKAININTGDVIYLDQKSLKEILQDDAELLESFQIKTRKTRRNSETRLEYLRKYSIKHKNEKIYCRDKIMNRGDADNFIQLQDSDTTYEFYYKRIVDKLLKNAPFTEVKLEKSHYKNGQLKFSGIKVKHELCGYAPYPYTIGIWRYFDKNGQLETEIMFDICQGKVAERHFDK
jgi:hypothetical protein